MTLTTQLNCLDHHVSLRDAERAGLLFGLLCQDATLLAELRRLAEVAPATLLSPVPVPLTAYDQNDRCESPSHRAWWQKVQALQSSGYAPRDFVAPVGIDADKEKLWLKEHQMSCPRCQEAIHSTSADPAKRIDCRTAPVRCSLGVTYFLSALAFGGSLCPGGGSWRPV